MACLSPADINEKTPQLVACIDKFKQGDIHDLASERPNDAYTGVLGVERPGTKLVCAIKHGKQIGRGLWTWQRPNFPFRFKLPCKVGRLLGSELSLHKRTLEILRIGLSIRLVVETFQQIGIVRQPIAIVDRLINRNKELTASKPD